MPIAVLVAGVAPTIVRLEHGGARSVGGVLAAVQALWRAAPTVVSALSLADARALLAPGAEELARVARRALDPFDLFDDSVECVLVEVDAGVRRADAAATRLGGNPGFSMPLALPTDGGGGSESGGILSIEGKVLDNLEALRLVQAQQGATLLTLVRESTEGSFIFSKASLRRVADAQQALGIEALGTLEIPGLEALARGGDFTAYAWARAEPEAQAAPALRALLEEWVRRGLPQRPRALIDVQGLASQYSLSVQVRGVGSFRGMPDAIFCHRGVRAIDQAIPIALSALVSVDWKRPAAMSETASIAAIGRIQAIAFAKAGRAVPVFFTDLCSGFRGWIVVGGYLYELHPPERALTLPEGVALIRHFLKCGDALQRPCVMDGVLIGGVGGGSEAGAGEGGAAGGGGGGGGSEAGVEVNTACGSNASGGGGGGGGGGIVGGAARRVTLPFGSRRASGGGSGVFSPCGSASGDDDEEDSPDTVFQRVAVSMAESFGLRVDFGLGGGDGE